MYPEIAIARGKDVPLIESIERTSFPFPWDTETLSACVELPSYRTWTAWLDGRIRGYITAVLDSGGLHIVNLAVEKDYRRIGIAGSLIESAESWAERLGADFSFLEVRESAVAARSLYSTSGYTQTALLDEYYCDGEKGLRFDKVLKPRSETSAVAFRILEVCSSIPPVGIVLGSGLSWLAEEFGVSIRTDFSAILGDSGPDLPGHPGEMLFSRCGRFVFLLGRRHYYQGYTGDEISLLPGVLCDLGVHTWILTSSSGAVDEDLRPGDAVLFRDHVNFTGCIPNIGRIRTGRSVYSEELRQAAIESASMAGSVLKEGIFACVSGPAYETSAEISFLQEHGFSTVSMSTVPEALLLAARGSEVAALSLVTNAAAPGAVVTHDEVLSSQESVRSKQHQFLSILAGKAASIALQ
ncbi:MAG: GNAT family N-acetyltransferase [Candidatus Aegiribacteria sp.]|nr:GNAT family N-acetyltransferase [Candidatus Aegiribacteria sp.]MBD3294131.1 GNAT family N-acetyltransferase [Candidatus Fermentibacteria bacterium]